MFCDYHVHSRYSDDSCYPMEDCVKDAIDMGMDEICFCDHVDYGVKLDPMDLEEEMRANTVLNVDYPRYFAQLSALQEAYRGQITIRKGLEFGMQTHTIAAFERLQKQWPLDFVILSIHQVNDQQFHLREFQKGKSEEQYHKAYYEELLAVIRQYKGYSVLGHLDLMKRYDDKDGYDGFVRHRELIVRILKQVIADGKGIELNTSSVRYGLDSLLPDERILRLYRELGGTILTIGSDSHAPAHLGTGIEEQKKTLKTIGFTHFCTFERMRPIFHPL